MTNQKFYWAYGSNLNVAQMGRRCPGARKVCAYPLLNLSLVFRGVADVVNNSGGKTQGGLWLITPECERALDDYEGVEAGLYRKSHIVLSARGEAMDCLFYQMNQRGIMPPSESYLDSIVQGYKDFGLDLAALDRALARSWSRKKPTNRLRARAKARGGQAARQLPLHVGA